jgi:hypothetical protein
MGCCGQKREALKSGPPVATAGTASATLSQPAVQAVQRATGWGQPPVESPVRVQYSERSRILVRGPVTGREYEFSASQSVQTVDGRDAPALLRTRYFQRIW